MPETLTRTSFISADVVKVATSKDTMWVISKDGLTVEKVPMPKSIKATGVIPEGYIVDFYYDPFMAVTVLARQGITTVEQLSGTLFEELKAQINGPENVTIAPTSVVESKREAIVNALKEGAMQQDEDSEAA